MRVADKQRAEEADPATLGGKQAGWIGQSRAPAVRRLRAGIVLGDGPVFVGLTLIAAKPTQMPSTWPATRWLLRRSSAP